MMNRFLLALLLVPILACNSQQASPTAAAPEAPSPGISIRVTGAVENHQEGDACEEPLALSYHKVYTSTEGVNYLIYEGVVKNVSGVEIRGVKVVAYAYDYEDNIIGQGENWIGISKGPYIYLPVDHSEFFTVNLSGFNIEGRYQNLDVQFYVSAEGFQALGHSTSE